MASEPSSTVYLTGQTSHDIPLLTNLTSSLIPSRPFSPPALSDPSYIPPDRSKQLIIGDCVTLAIVILAFTRRIYVRIMRCGAGVAWHAALLFEDFIVFLASASYITSTGLSLYATKKLQWGVPFENWTVHSAEESMRVMYACRYLADLYMTCVRIGLLLCFRRLYIQTVTRRVITFKVIVILSVCYVFVALFFRLFFCGGHVSSGFDVWKFAANKCDSRYVEMTLSALDAALDFCVVAVLFMVVWTLSSERTKRNPAMFITQPFFPCRPMVGTGLVGTVPALLRIYFSRNNLDFNCEVNGMMCSQVEGGIFILMSCGPMIRTLLTDYVGKGKHIDLRNAVVWSGGGKDGKAVGRTESDATGTTFATTGTMGTTGTMTTKVGMEKVEGGRDEEAVERKDTCEVEDTRRVDIVPKSGGETQQNAPASERASDDVVMASSGSSTTSNSSTDEIIEQVIPGGLGPRPESSPNQLSPRPSRHFQVVSDNM